MKRFVLPFVLPTLALLAWSMAPVIGGGETLYLRDVFNTHLGMKWVQAEAMAEGVLPLVDPARGGQPHLGNPNTVSLYPDNLLYLALPFFRAFNAHFWLHLLLAPAAFFLFARAWGLGWPAAWLGGVVYAGSGYFLSTLNLYNLVAGTTLAPTFVAAVLGLGGERPRRALVATALLWGLLLLAGDPVLAAFALLLAVSAAVVRRRVPVAVVGRGAVALAAGSALAAPQIVTFLAILPLSFRGHFGFSASAATAASWNPATALEWLLPLAFGAPGFGFWGQGMYSGQPPLYYSFYPGLAALALVLSLLLGARPGRPRAALWGWLAVGVGLFFALGRFNPVVGWVLLLPGAELFRFPVKLWLLVAVGASLLAALAAEAWAAGQRRPLARSLLLLGIVLAAAWGVLTLAPGWAEGWLRELVPSHYGDAFVAAERLRWAGLCLLSLGVLAAVGLVSRQSRARPRAGLAVLAALHLATQLWFLAPLLASEEVEPYRRPPAALAALPAGARVVQGGIHRLFGPTSIPVGEYPDARLIWFQRQLHRELYPFSGVRFGLRYELAPSPEGLDSFLTRAAAQAVERLPDPARLRVLAAMGVEYLLLGRDLAPGAAGLVERVAELPVPGGALRVYRLERAAPPVAFVGGIRRAPHLNAALAQITDPGFDPRREVVLPGPGPVRAPGPAGRARVLARSAEALTVEVDAPVAGALVVQRVWLPIWRARLDGEPVPVRVANLDRMAVEVPPGRHRVELEIPRRSLSISAAVAALAALGLLAACLPLGGRGSPVRRGRGGR